MLIAAIPLALFVHRLHKASRQRMALEQISELGGEYRYDFEEYWPGGTLRNSNDIGPPPLPAAE